MFLLFLLGGVIIDTNNNEDKKWTVYIHISPSNKKYVGITSLNPPKKRWANGKGYSKNKYFIRAIEKYGWNNFEHIIYMDNLSEKEAKALEIKLIAEYKSNQNEYGYNITNGGEGANGHKLEQYHIDALKAASSIPVYQFDKDYNFIREFSSIREAARYYNANKTNIRECCSMKQYTSHGYIWRYKKDVQDPYNKNCIPKYNPKKNSKPVYKIDIYTREYILYDNIAEASRLENLEYEYIYNCCNKKARKFYNNCLWIYYDDVNDIELFIKDDLNFNSGRAKSIEQYDLNGNYIKWFKSMSEVAKELGLNRKKIASVCNVFLDNYGGFVWKYI